MTSFINKQGQKTILKDDKPKFIPLYKQPMIIKKSVKQVRPMKSK